MGGGGAGVSPDGSNLGFEGASESRVTATGWREYEMSAILDMLLRKQAPGPLSIHSQAMHDEDGWKTPHRSRPPTSWAFRL
jgi:hypothetical protein